QRVFGGRGGHGLLGHAVEAPGTVLRHFLATGAEVHHGLVAGTLILCSVAVLHAVLSGLLGAAGRGVLGVLATHVTAAGAETESERGTGGGHGECALTDHFSLLRLQWSTFSSVLVLVCGRLTRP